MIRPVLSTLSPAGSRARLSILVFHRVLADSDPLFPEIPCAERFERQMRWVASWFNVLPLSEAVERLTSASLPARAMSITFDDGYADNETVAAPILRRLGLTATFFVTSGALNGGRMWNDTVIEAIRRTKRPYVDLRDLGLGVFDVTEDANRRQVIDLMLAAIKRLPGGQRAAIVRALEDRADAELPEHLMMSTEQVRSLCRLGMEIGGHTMTHPILTQIDDHEALREIAQGKDDLQQITGLPITLFAYPNGVPGIDFEERHVAMARRSGFRAAFSTARGCATMRSDVFQLPRFTPWDRGRIRYALRLVDNLLRDRRAVTCHGACGK